MMSTGNFTRRLAVGGPVDRATSLGSRVYIRGYATIFFAGAQADSVNFAQGALSRSAEVEDSRQ